MSGGFSRRTSPAPHGLQEQGDRLQEAQEASCDLSGLASPFSPQLIPGRLDGVGIQVLTINIPTCSKYPIPTVSQGKILKKKGALVPPSASGA